MMRLSCLVACTMVLCAAEAQTSRLPEWVREAIDQGHPEYPPDVAAVNLLDDGEFTVLGPGRIRMQQRMVIKVLRPDGRSRARGAVSYNAKADRISRFSAWLLQPDGKVETFPHSVAIDTERSTSGVLATEVRRRSISATQRAEEGSIFAYEWVKERRSIYAQDTWWLRGFSPVVRSTLTYTVPHGWSLRATPINGAQYTESRQRQTWVWEARNIPHIPNEPWRPHRGSLRTAIGIDIVPPRPLADFVTFDSWTDVAIHQRAQSEAAMEPDASVHQQARELVSGLIDPWEQIRAIARFCQDMNYVAILIDLRNGGGFRPFPAPTVLQRRYGDCKDKTTIMRSLLASIGIESFSVGVHASSTGTQTDPAWPSLFQFDHMIVALKPPPGLESPAIAEVPGLGPLLFFDPTDPTTPIGDLPGEIQGNWAIVDSTSAGGLVRIPSLPSHLNARRESIVATLDADGSLRGTIESHRSGREATALRRSLFRSLEREARERKVRVLHAELPGADLGEFNHVDSPDDGSMVTHLSFSHREHARLIAGRMLVFRPVVWGKAAPIPAVEPDSTRVNPVHIEGRHQEQSFVIDLPDGYTLEEPASGAVHAEDFGSYALSFEHADGQLRVQRTWTTEESVLPPDEFDRVHAFFRAVLEADNRPVVLIRNTTIP